MKIKNGFTLVELLAIISLLGILLLFVYPKIINIQDKKEAEIDSAKKTLINNATIEYMNKNLNNYPQEIGNKYYISLETLDYENLIGIDIDDIMEKYNYVQVTIGLNNNNSYNIINYDINELIYNKIDKSSFSTVAGTKYCVNLSNILNNIDFNNIETNNISRKYNYMEITIGLNKNEYTLIKYSDSNCQEV